MKPAVSLLVMLLLLFCMGQYTNLAKANPLPSAIYPETPDKNEPVITIEVPKNDAVLDVNYTALFFTVKKPTSWFNIYPIHGDLRSISYIIDGRMVDVGGNKLELEHQNPSTLTYTQPISGLSEGKHTLKVNVKSVSYYLEPERPPDDVYGSWKYPPANYFMDTYSSTINFTVDIQSLQPSPTQSSILTLQPTVNTGPHVDYGVINLLYFLGIMAIVIVVIVGSLFYFKRGKGKP
jgi:hypothetical protein